MITADARDQRRIMPAVANAHSKSVYKLCQTTSAEAP